MLSRVLRIPANSSVSRERENPPFVGSTSLALARWKTRASSSLYQQREQAVPLLFDGSSPLFPLPPDDVFRICRLLPINERSEKRRRCFRDDAFPSRDVSPDGRLLRWRFFIGVLCFFSTSLFRPRSYWFHWPGMGGVKELLNGS